MFNVVASDEWVFEQLRYSGSLPRVPLQALSDEVLGNGRVALRQLRQLIGVCNVEQGRNLQPNMCWNVLGVGLARAYL